MGKNYSPEYKVEFCKRVIEGGEKVAELCRETGIKENTAYGWIARHNENPTAPFSGSGHIKAEDEAFKRLQRENRELREEVEILKKAAVYFAKILK